MPIGRMDLASAGELPIRPVPDQRSSYLQPASLRSRAISAVLSAGLTLLTDTMQHVYRNVLVDKRGSLVVVPGFQYVLPVGMMRKGMGAVTDDEMQNHSLVAFRAPHGSLPIFQVYSRGAIGNVGIPVDATAFSGMKTAAGVDTGSPEFSERYVISTKDEAGVARAFTPALVKAFVDQPAMTWLHVQTSADWLLFYDPRILILKPEDVEPALQRVRPIASLLLGAPPATA